MTPGMAYDVDKRPATWVSQQVAKRRSRMILLAALGATIVGLLVTMMLLHHHTFALVLSIAVIPILVSVWHLPDKLGDDLDLWSLGERAERSIGELLNQLRSEGFIVMHDVEQAYEGNIDHIVSGSTGVFMIESKARRYDDDAPRKARRQAKKLSIELDAKWVGPVICLNKRDRKPFQHEGVWIVPKQHLLDWIRAQREPKVPFERLALWADKL
jgi:Nuclease-related domain